MTFIEIKDYINDDIFIFYYDIKEGKFKTYVNQNGNLAKKLEFIFNLKLNNLPEIGICHRPIRKNDDIYTKKITTIYIREKNINWKLFEVYKNGIFQNEPLTFMNIKESKKINMTKKENNLILTNNNININKHDNELFILLKKENFLLEMMKKNKIKVKFTNLKTKFKKLFDLCANYTNKLYNE